MLEEIAIVRWRVRLGLYLDYKKNESARVRIIDRDVMIVRCER